MTRFSLGAPGSWSRVLLAKWSWIVLTASLVTAVAAAVAEMQTPIYKAQAEVAVYPASATGSALQPFVMGTEKEIASSGAVLSSLICKSVELKEKQKEFWEIRVRQ